MVMQARFSSDISVASYLTTANQRQAALGKWLGFPSANAMDFNAMGFLGWGNF